MLGLVSPILNRGVRSRWVSTLPAGSKMLTIDAAGDVSYTDIPTAAWGSITGTLSNQTDLQNALNAKLSLTGGTVTGQLTNALGTITASTPLTLTQTWNNAAVTFTGALVNVTDTASNGSSLLMDLQVGGDSKFKVRKSGVVTIKTGFVSDAGIYGDGTNWDLGVNGTTKMFWISESGVLSRGVLYVGSTDVVLVRDAAQTLAQRNSTNAQAYRIYNTFTDASNYQRVNLAWESNEFRLGTQKGGAGGSGEVAFGYWSSGGVFTQIQKVEMGGSVIFGNASLKPYVHIQSGANSSASFYSASNGVLMLANWNADNFNRLQLGGTTSSFPAIKRNGTAINFRLADDSADAGITASTATFSGRATISEYIVTSVHNEIVAGADGSGYYFGCGLGSGTQPSFIGVAGAATSVFVGGTTGSLFLRGKKLAFRVSDALGGQLLQAESSTALSLIDSTNAQTFRVYNTYTDASNYERGKIEWSSNVLRIGTEKAGTGSARALELQTDGTTRLTIATNGDVTTASNFSVGNNSIYLGGSGVIRLADYTRIHTPDSYGPIDIAPMTNNVTGVVRVYNTIRSLTNYERLECGQAYNANAFIRTAAGGTGTRRNLEIDAPEIKIAIATTQKIGFYNATPVDQPDTIADPTGGATIDAEARTAINALIDRLQELGLIAT